MTQRLTFGQVLTGIRDFGLRVVAIESALPAAFGDAYGNTVREIVARQSAGTLATMHAGDVVSTVAGYSTFGEVATFTVRDLYGYHGTLEIRPNHGGGYRVQADQRFRDMIEA